MILTRAAGATGRIWAVQRGLHGVRPAGFPTGGDFPCPLDNDTETGDETSQFLWHLLPPLIDSTSGGTTTTTDAGGYDHAGGDDGTYVQGYGWSKVTAAGAVVEDDSTITVNIGESGVVITSATSATAASTPAGTQRQVGSVSGAASSTSLSDPAAASGPSIAAAASATTMSSVAGAQRQVGAVEPAVSSTATAQIAPPATEQRHGGGPDEDDEYGALLKRLANQQKASRARRQAIQLVATMIATGVIE